MFSQDGVAIHCRCGGKYDTDLVANLPLNMTVKEFLRLVNSFQSYEQILSGTIFYGSRCSSPQLLGGS